MTDLIAAAQRIVELGSKATPGDWRIRTNARHTAEECDLSICGDIFVLADINGPQYPHQEANAAFIVAARNHAPALAAEYLRLREVEKAARLHLINANGHYSDKLYDAIAALDAHRAKETT